MHCDILCAYFHMEILALATLTFLEDYITCLTIFQSALHDKLLIFYKKRWKTHNLDER